jgi:hypothetical protein
MAHRLPLPLVLAPQSVILSIHQDLPPKDGNHDVFSGESLRKTVLAEHCEVFFLELFPVMGRDMDFLFCRIELLIRFVSSSFLHFYKPFTERISLKAFAWKLFTISQTMVYSSV